MNRFIAWATVALAAGNACGADSAPKPSVVLILADDLVYPITRPSLSWSP